MIKRFIKKMNRTLVSLFYNQQFQPESALKQNGQILVLHWIESYITNEKQILFFDEITT